MKIEAGKVKPKEDGAGKTKVKSRRPVFIYLFCLFLAAITWLLISLAKEYRHEIRLPYALVKMPSGKVPVGKIPNAIRVEVEATGFALLSYSFRSSKTALPLDVSAFLSTGSSNDASRLVLPLETILHDRFFNEHTELRFLNVFPSELVISFSDSYSKRVPVRWKGSIQYAAECDSIGAPQLVPDTVTVYGSEALLKKLDHLDTKQITITNIAASFKRKVKLDSGDLTVEPDYIAVAQQVQRYTGQTEELQVHALHLPDGLHLRLLPNRVTVTYRMPLYSSKDVSSPLLKAEVDMHSAQSGSGKVKVIVSDVTGQAKKMKASPAYIDYILIH